jgi:hypothetical protein
MVGFFLVLTIYVQTALGFSASGVAVVGVVFFGITGREDAITTASWVSVIGFALCAAATMLLPSRAAVRAHADAVAVLSEA